MELNPLFKGLTRPAMLFGVPITPLFLIIGGIFVISVVLHQMLLCILMIPAFFVLKIMAKKDDFIFRLYFLKVQLFTNPLAKKFFHAKTYSAMKYTKLPKNSGFPKISLFNLESNPSLERFIPYSSLITDSVVMSKDCMFLTTWRLEGVSFECEDDDSLDSFNNRLNMLFMAFANEPISFYVHNCRHSTEDKLTSAFNNTFLSEVDKKYFESFQKGTLQKNSLYFTIVFNAIKTKVEKSSFLKHSLEKKYKELKGLLQIFAEYCAKIESNLSSFKPIRLKTYIKDDVKYSKQLEFYNYLIGGRFYPIRVLNSPLNEYLMGNLQDIAFNHDMVQLNYNDDTKQFARAIEIKDYRENTYAGILDILMYLKINYIITQSFSPLARVEAKAALSKQKKQLISSEDDSMSQIEELDYALDSLASGNISFGKYHFSIIVFGESVKECRENTNDIITSLNDLGFNVTLANIALPATYFAQFPCNFALRPRINLISSLNYSSLIGLHNFSVGKRDKNCWGEACTILKTPNGAPYYLNFHQSSNKDDFGKLFLANTLIIGQSGGGKTVFMNFLVNQMMKYASKDSFPLDTPEEKKKFSLVYLDKDKGALANILCAGGRYISIENGVPTGFNPFMIESTQANIRNLQELIKLLVTRKGEILTTKEEKKINDAINFIMTQFAQDERKYPISLLLENITEDFNDDNSLKARLNAFKKGNQFGWVFDNEKDNLDFPDTINLFGIDGTEFLDDKDVSAILCYYILWRVMDLADGRRLCIDIDEAWKWLENEVVAEEVKNKFKTIRKQNGMLRLGTQSVEDFLRLSISKSLIEQSATMIFLSNPKAQEKDYMQGLNLSREEYEIIRDFDPASRQFLVKRQDEKVICTLDLSSLGATNLKILSTGTQDIDVVEKIFAQEHKSLEQKVSELKLEYSRN
ncbi:type IV secretion system protein VirB4 [Helicobacter didelphidarum]|uniref:Type IV secretion system protein VirB4 n=1 Tax=Helicobacter didelphidarum TaxID=2040648 RepID=A0A3D8IAY5_9HELI|nr:VirB4 family type IV secretion/conjugal transfer ATPase [Helicobacter didelphidarum]RDU62116.1 type IV secretion system protein VirB4 [Helicobacter didelphidarum]